MTPVKTKPLPVIVGFSMDHATPSQKQVMGILNRDAIKKDRTFIYWMGGVRAGKSFGAAMAFMEHQRYRKGKKYLILAYTQTQALEIYGPYFETIGEAMGMTVKTVRGANARIDVKETGNSFLIKGADKAGKDRSIQGLTMEGLLADEVVLLNRDALHQAEARVSGVGGLRIYTSNKANMYHWTTKYYIERIKKKEINGTLIDCGLADNPHVNDDFAAERAAEFTGNTLHRFINNEFTLDGSPIFDVGMGLYPTTGAKIDPYVAVFGHANGYEVLEAQVLHVNKEVHLNLISAASLKDYHQIRPFLKGGVRVLVNATQPIMARWLRRQGVPVKGYLEHAQNTRVEVMRKACADDQVWVNTDSEALLEAVKTYYDANRMDFPVMMAVEAMGEVLRSFVTLSQPNGQPAS